MSDPVAGELHRHHLANFHLIRDWIEKRTALAVGEPQPAKPNFNARLALWITNAVGTMWCAYLFTALALISLPQAVHGGTATLISWIAQTFLQLVLLSIIMVGQKVAAEASDRQAYQTYKDAEAILQISDQLQQLITVNNKLTEEIHQSMARKKS
ncbi:MAG: hypothetical protein H0W71_07000 [Sphingomonas sp.]|nr:hypothetical protein [Sphingomonas sp.]